VAEERRDIARNALKELFPPIEWAFGGPYYAEDFHSQWLTAKRACTKRYFPRYFELQTATGEMSESRFVAFLDATATEDGLATAIADVEADGLLSSLVARFDESVGRLPVENADVLLPGMFAIAQKFAGQNDGGFFSSPWISAWRATSWFLKRIPHEARRDLVLDALRRTEALSVAAILIHLSDPADRTEGGSGAFDPALDPDTVEAMKTEWLRLMRNRAADGDALIADPDLVNLLYRWRDYTASLDEPQKWVSETIRSDHGFAKMATRMLTRGTTHSSGDRVSKSYYGFNKQTITDFIGIEEAKARCDAIRSVEFPDHEPALRTLRSKLDEWQMRATSATAD
jgi:predicted KAP-like P-loop ATPase